MYKEDEQDSILKEFGKRLKMLREERDIPMSKLAADVGTTKSGISRYENGKTDPGLTTLIKFAEYFNVTIDWLGGNGDITSIKYAHLEQYENAINKSVEVGISPMKLERMIDIYKE